MIDRFKRRLFGEEDVRRDLPERVSRAIESQQADSEILIAWMQFAVVCVFAILYAVAPKGFSEEVAFAPVPWVLGAFLGFSLLRLGLVRRGYQPRWFLALSVVLDMGLLMALIWSFHLQYEQPAPFYLKAPTMLYVFIFVALRSLRFDPWFVLLTGASAALGWLSLLGYAVWEGDSRNMMTRDFVEYVTTNKILLGAEFDKVISITMTTLILAVAIVRARRLLVHSVTQQSAARDLSRFFAPEVAQAITESRQRVEPGTGEARTAAILHCDIRGFTPLSRRMAPNDLIALLIEYESRLVPEIRRHGGSIDKFLGDGIMATFGAALPTETYAADAMRAMEGLVAVSDGWRAEQNAAGRPPLDIRFTVAVGQVVFGAVGDASRLEYTVIGDPVNLAAKLDQLTKTERGRGVTTKDSFEAALAQGYRPKLVIECRAGRRVEGFEQPVDLAVLQPE